MGEGAARGRGEWCMVKWVEGTRMCVRGLCVRGCSKRNKRDSFIL